MFVVIIIYDFLLLTLSYTIMIVQYFNQSKISLIYGACWSDCAVVCMCVIPLTSATAPAVESYHIAPPLSVRDNSFEEFS